MTLKPGTPAIDAPLGKSASVMHGHSIRSIKPPARAEDIRAHFARFSAPMRNDGGCQPVYRPRILTPCHLRRNRSRDGFRRSPWVGNVAIEYQHRYQCTDTREGQQFLRAFWASEKPFRASLDVGKGRARSLDLSTPLQRRHCGLPRLLSCQARAVRNGFAALHFVAALWVLAGTPSPAFGPP
jgi:hypothetical protein